MRRIFGFVPNVVFLGLVSLFNDFSNEMVLAVMPAFLTSLGAAPVLIGFLEGFADALASVMRIFSGWFSDRIHRRKIVAVTGYGISVATRAFLASVVTVPYIFLLRAIDRVGKGIREAPRDALLAESVDEKELGKSFGLHRSLDAIGGILGPLCAVILLPYIHGDYRKLFWIAFLIGLCAVGSFVFVKEKKTPRISVAEQRRKLSLSALTPAFKLYLSAIFLFGLGAFPVSLMLLKVGTGLTLASSIPLMYLIYSTSFTLLALPFGKLADRLGERKIILLGFFIAALAYAVLAIGTSVAVVISGFILWGAYSAMTDGVLRAYAAKLVPQELLASGQGLLGAAIGFSSLAAGLVGGLIWTVYGSSYALLYGSSMMAAGALAFFILNGDAKNTLSV